MKYTKIHQLLLRRKKVLSLATLVMLLCVVGVVMWQRSFPSEQPSKTITIAGIVNHSVDKPSDQKPDKSFVWQGASTEPKYIQLPSIGAGGYIQKVGVDQNDQIAVPSNVHFAGWFVDTVMPGQKGLSIIDGHIVTGRNSLGIFQDLSKLRKGDTFTITFGNDSLKKFSVVSVQTLDNKEVPQVLFSQDSKISNQLNLITCGGDYDEGTGQYQQRVVVTSKHIQEQ